MWMEGRDGKRLMQYYGWNGTNYDNPGPGTPWSRDAQGLVWDRLTLPANKAVETERLPKS